MASTRSKGKGSGMLARRKAALERAAGRVAEQRREAEEAEAQRRRREVAFDELAADFELAVEDEASVAAEVEEEVCRVRERGQVRIDEARLVAARVVWAMGEDETVAGCGRRLGVGVDRVKELRRLWREAGDGEESPGKVKADGPVKVSGSGGQVRDGVQGAGQAGAVLRGGAAAGSVPPVTAPVVSVAVPAGPSGGVGGARPVSLR
ncbi:hypothetical protein ACWF9B_00390 [Streptomyces sp. NPDC055089]